MSRLSRKTIVSGGAAALLAAGAATAAGSGPGDDDAPGLSGTDLQRAADAAVAAAGGGRVTDVEVDDDTRTYELEITREDGTAVDVWLDQGFGVLSSVAEQPDPDDRPLSATELDRASAAALEAAGGGRVTDADLDDDGMEYEIEVAHDDGSEIDVELNRDFVVVELSRDEPGDD